LAPLTRALAAALLLCAASASAKTPARLRVLTFNAAGIPLVHPRIRQRVAAMGRAFARDEYDIIGLQEVWLQSDSERLAQGSGLPYKARTDAAALTVGTGLTILSRWPILAVKEREFSALRPSLRNLPQGEPLAHKGFMMARVKTPWGELDVYDAHTISDYPSSQYEALRLTQLYDLAEGVLELSSGRPFVILGDLNTGPGKRDYELFMALTGVRDLCRGGGRELCGDPKRPWRIDNIFVPPGRLNAPARRVLDRPIEGLLPPLNYSDHSGFAADVSPALLSMRAHPNNVRRTAALRTVSETMTRMIGRLNERKRAWIPLYGAYLAARYDRQIAVLAAFRERAISARAALKP